MSKHKDRVRYRNPKLMALRNLEGAFWMIGLAILFYKGWFWPGILVLVALSTVFESVLAMAYPREVEEETAQNAATVPPTPPAAPVPPVPPTFSGVEKENRVMNPAASLPSNCPRCGAPARGHDVHWTSSSSADCAFCGANLPLKS